MVRLSLDSPWRIRRNVARVALSPIFAAVLRLRGVDVGLGARFYGRPVVFRYRGSRIRIGDKVEMRSARLSNVLGVGHPVILTTLARQARIVIGDEVALSGTTICAAESISIGRRSIVGIDGLITDTDHHPISGPKPRYSMTGAAAAPVEIGEDVFIGARVLILKGARIGNRAVVGAGSVVTGAVPDDAIVAGNPARVVGRVGAADSPDTMYTTEFSETLGRPTEIATT